MTPETRPGIKRRETEGFGLGCVDDFPNIDFELPTGKGHLIGKGNVDAAIGIFEKFHHLRRFRRRDWDDGLDDLLIKKCRQFGTTGSHATDHFGNILGRIALIAGIHPLR